MLWTWLSPTLIVMAALVAAGATATVERFDALYDLIDAMLENKAHA